MGISSLLTPIETINPHPPINISNKILQVQLRGFASQERTINCLYRLSNTVIALGYLMRILDLEVRLLEMVLPVRYREHWVAIDFGKLNRIGSAMDLKPCAHTQSNGKAGKSDFISLDTWKELLDPPEDGVSIF